MPALKRKTSLKLVEARADPKYETVIEVLDSHDERLAVVEEGVQAILWVKTFLARMTPVMIGALLASGVVTGPMGKALAYIVKHWPA